MTNTSLQAAGTHTVHIYSFVLSGHAHRARLMCSLLGLGMRVTELDLPAGEHKRPDFLRLNSMGQVPVLEDEGTVIADSNAILVYLATKYDTARTWYPSDAVRASRVQRWLSLAAGELARGPAAARRARVFGGVVEEQALTTAARLLQAMEGELAGRRFLCGDVPTIADVAMYTYTACSSEGGITLEPYAAVRAWLVRVEALPGFIDMARSPAAKTSG